MTQVRWDRARYVVVALVCAGTIANYLARNSLAVLAPRLQQELPLSTQQYSYIVASFQLAYTVMQPVCGYLLDRIGLRIGFALFAALWSLTNMLHALAGGLVSFMILRAILGLTEAAAIPAGVKAVSEWFPQRERSVAIGYLNAGTSVGAMLAPPLVIGLTAVAGWPTAFVTTGGIGLLWAALWWRVYKSPPSKIPAAAAPRPSLRRIIARRAFWGIAIARFLAEPAWQTFSFFIPLYLATERHLQLREIALFAWLPFLAADLGGILGGYLSPFLVRRLRLSLVNSRIAGVWVGALFMLGPGLIGLVRSAPSAIALLCLGAFGHQMISSLLNVLGTDVFSHHELATANGLTGTASWTGGLGFSLLVGALAGTLGYAPLFACLSLFDVLGAVVVFVLVRDASSATAEDLPQRSKEL